MLEILQIGPCNGVAAAATFAGGPLLGLTAGLTLELHFGVELTEHKKADRLNRLAEQNGWPDRKAGRIGRLVGYLGRARRGS